MPSVLSIGGFGELGEITASAHCVTRYLAALPSPQSPVRGGG